MLPFTGNPLNRASERRSDTGWIAEQKARGFVLPLWQLQVLTEGEQSLTAARVPVATVEKLAGPDAVWVFLGLDGDVPLSTVDVTATADAVEVLKPFGEFRELRGASLTLRHADLAILSQAKAMIDWHLRHPFCPRCGGKTVAGEAGYKRTCSQCGAEHFPRTDPAVIMLPICGERCLVARNKNWPPDFYSALAGFVEPGETFEEAVRRELHEEAGVVAREVIYYAGQPWPFPYSIMIGFFARCESTAVKLDPNELVDSMWLTKEQARALLDGAVEGRRGPFPPAIAHHLIRAWVNGEAG